MEPQLEITQIIDSPEYFEKYTKTFVQRRPLFGWKSFSPGARWSLAHQALNDTEIKKHLKGEQAIGTLGPWYPQYALLDLDHKPATIAEEIRAGLGLNDKNSMRFSSESLDSWHILFKPHLNNEPPPLTRFNNVLKKEAKKLDIEVYPQKKRVIRLPFGRGQYFEDRTTGFFLNQVELLDEFLKLDPFDITGLEEQQSLKFKGTIGQRIPLPTASGFIQNATYLYDHGLQGPGTRHNAQFAVAVLLYRKMNFSPDQTVDEVWKWVNEKHNGQSRDILRHPQQVKREIIAQVQWLYHNTYFQRQYPDVVHNNHHGFIHKDDLPGILEATRGNVPRSRYLFHILKYCYPRQHRISVNIHTDKLRQWAGTRTSLQYLKEFETQGILKRGSQYQVDRFSKPLFLNWPFRPVSECAFVDGRTVETFQDFVRYCHTNPRDFRDLLQSKGAERTTALKATKTIYETVKKDTTL